MTLIYSGERAIGEDVARRLMENLVLRQGVAWDMPNQVNPDTGEVVFGTDFYQMLILWRLPLAIGGQNISDACRPHGFIQRILYPAGMTSTSRADKTHPIEERYEHEPR